MNKKNRLNGSMQKHRRRLLNLAVSSCMVLLSMQAGMAQVAPEPLRVADIPLILGNALFPNIFYVHDDSGSMAWSHMPDAIEIAAGTQNGSLDHNVGTTQNGVTMRAFGFSSDFNKVYFDPTMQYDPPMRADGSSFPDSDFNSAWVDGYRGEDNNQSWVRVNDANLSRINLNTQFQPTWRFSHATNGFTQSNAGRLGTRGTPQRAYYYQYDPGCTDANVRGYPPDSCFERRHPVTEEERQNFANWYSYYRTRYFSARAGVSQAFVQLDPGVRVGYGQINQSAAVDGKGSLRGVRRGVREFQGAAREEFYDWLLNGALPEGSTPLRAALHGASQYFDDTDGANIRGPWSTHPGQTTGNIVSCRRSYIILMTDGYADPAWVTTVGNADSMAEREILLEDGSSYTYTPSDPFRDNFPGDQDHSQGNLADIAMHYWKRDLLPQPEYVNNVPPTPRDPATWQHLSVFAVGLGVEGSIPQETAWEAVTNGTRIRDRNGAFTDWPVPTGEGAIDDMLHAAINSRGGFFQANNPRAFAAAMHEILQSIAKENNSTAPMAASSSRLSNEFYSFRAEFDSTDWRGVLKAYKYEVNPLDPDDGSFTEAWSTYNTALNPDPDSRQIFTWRNGQGGDLSWGQLDAYQKGLFNNDENLLKWFRGDRNQEQRNGGVFRNRNETTVLGDIVNSGLAFVGQDNYGYAYYGGMTQQEKDAYTARLNSSTFKDRNKMVYVGANDGMLHAFNAEGVNAGQEAFAYAPAGVMAKIPTLADPEYTHTYTVDGTPAIGDAYINGAWRTVLVGSVGAGASSQIPNFDTSTLSGSYFALNVENPSSTVPADDRVMWEFSDPLMGSAVIGTASIVKTESGDWVVILGNGFNSAAGTAALMIVNLETGALIRSLEVSGDATLPNGLATPVAVDINRNGLVDMVYAGDYQGNLWKFDLSGASSSQWEVAFSGDPLFKAVGPANTAQPITAQPAVRSNTVDGIGVVVYFGTGKSFLEGDQSDKSVQSFYGIFDRCGLQVSGTVSSTDCSSGSGSAKVERSDLLVQQGNRTYLA